MRIGTSLSTGRATLLAAVIVGGAIAGAAIVNRTGSNGSVTLPPVGSALSTRSISVHSDALGRDMPVEVFVPSSAVAGSHSGPPPVLFLFHGRGGDETTWFAGHGGDGIGLDSLAERLIGSAVIAPVAIVSARIDDSYGVDSAPSADGYAHGRFEQYIVDELIPTIEHRYAVGGSPSLRAVGGMSMGGFTALHLALERPAMFGRVGALSPALFVSPPSDRTWIYGGGRDPLMLARTASPLPAAFLGWGARDNEWIRAGTAELAARLRARHDDLASAVVEGGHDASTWRELARPMLTALFGR